MNCHNSILLNRCRGVNVIRHIGHTFSGVATGWQGWTMSRGPGGKRAPERDTKKKKKKERKKKKKKRKENEEKNRVNKLFK